MQQPPPLIYQQPGIYQPTGPTTILITPGMNLNSPYPIQTRAKILTNYTF
jgi:hypothetical protein